MSKPVLCCDKSAPLSVVVSKKCTSLVLSRLLACLLHTSDVSTLFMVDKVTREQAGRLAGWQADQVPRQACHPSLEGLPPPGQPASLALFFGVQPFFTRTSPTTSGHVFCSEEWSKCVNKLLWESQTGKYAQESDSMTRRVNRFTNTTKLAIYKSSELRGNY